MLSQGQGNHNLVGKRDLYIDNYNTRNRHNRYYCCINVNGREREIPGGQLGISPLNGFCDSSPTTWPLGSESCSPVAQSLRTIPDLLSQQKEGRKGGL